MNTVCGNTFNSTTRGPDSVDCMSALGSVADVMRSSNWSASCQKQTLVDRAMSSTGF
jgi:hypothetical protein